VYIRPRKGFDRKLHFILSDIKCCASFEVLTFLLIKITVLWAMIPCMLEYRCQCLEGPYRPHFYTTLKKDAIISSKTLILCEYPQGIISQETVVFFRKYFIQGTGLNYYCVNTY
jgi:hypothetical protein